MYHFRYYAVGHSYLLHGPFPGWQVDGFWGMAASEPSRDYFHRFQSLLQETFDCRVEAVAENHATYERRCAPGATKETYQSSPEYCHIKEVLQKFKPNLISLFIGDGNVVSKDEQSLTLFFETLYEMVADQKREDAVVLCPIFRKMTFAVCAPIAERYGFLPIDCSFIHEKKGSENPYYAYCEYPEYDEARARGAIEFRTHPNDRGHEAIARAMLGTVCTPIGASIAEGELDEAYEYESYVLSERLPEFAIERKPENLKVRFYGFNLRQEDGCVVFGSAPGTGAAVAAEELVFPKNPIRFFIELEVRGVTSPTKLCAIVQGLEKSETVELLLTDEHMHRYEIDVSTFLEPIRTVRVSPELTDCVLAVKAIGFLMD